MTPAGTSNELDVQNGWEENTHTTWYSNGFSNGSNHGSTDNVGEKPTAILYTYINHHAQPPIITQHDQSVIHSYEDGTNVTNSTIKSYKNRGLLLFKKNLNASKPSEHPPQVEECLKV